VKDEVFRAVRAPPTGRSARAVARANKVWPSYDEYAKKTEREIPVVVLERIGS